MILWPGQWSPTRRVIEAKVVTLAARVMASKDEQLERAADCAFVNDYARAAWSELDRREQIEEDA